MKQELDIISTNEKKAFLLPSYEGIFELIMIVLVLGVGTNSFIEYRIGGLNIFTIKNIVLIGVISIAMLLYKVKVLHNFTVFSISIYAIILSITASLFFRIDFPDFQFEAYFIKVELLLVVLSFVMGFYVHPKHKLIIACYNIVFTVCCAILISDYPIEKFIFYTILVSSVVLFGYKVAFTLKRMKAKIEEDGILKKIVEEDITTGDSYRNIVNELELSTLQVSTLVDLLESSKSKKEHQEYIRYMKISLHKNTSLLDSLEDISAQNKKVYSEKFYN